MVSLTILLKVDKMFLERTNNIIRISLENKLVIHLRDDVVDLDTDLVPDHQVDHLGVGPFLQSDDSN